MVDRLVGDGVWLVVVAGAIYTYQSTHSSIDRPWDPINHPPFMLDPPTHGPLVEDEGVVEGLHYGVRGPGEPPAPQLLGRRGRGALLLILWVVG